MGCENFYRHIYYYFGDCYRNYYLFTSLMKIMEFDSLFSSIVLYLIWKYIYIYIYIN